MAGPTYDKPTTVGVALRWAYADLAKAHSALADGAASYGQLHFIVRARLFKGLTTGTMNVGTLLDDERVKFASRGCCYCGREEKLTLDHLVPVSRGGSDAIVNIVWACQSCNSSKGGRDLLVWYDSRGLFPPLMLYRRYLKLAILHCTERGLVDTGLDDTSGIPFAFDLMVAGLPKLDRLQLVAAPPSPSAPSSGP